MNLWKKQIISNKNMKKIMYVSGKVREKYRLLIEKKLKLYKYKYYTKLISKIISTKIPVSNNIMKRYLNI